MSQQIEEIKTNIKEIQAGLQAMGANRVVALSVHVTKELVADLEEKAVRTASLVETL